MFVGRVPHGLEMVLLIVCFRFFLPTPNARKGLDCFKTFVKCMLDDELAIVAACIYDVFVAFLRHFSKFVKLYNGITYQTLCILLLHYLLMKVIIRK